jgi:ABC-type multidrug transport system fused ATPase/permease subunit
MNVLKKIIDYPARQVRFFSIDFTKPWWYIFLPQKTKIIAVLFSTILFNILNTLFPLLLGWALETENIYNLVFIIIIYLIEELSSWILWNPQITLLYSETLQSFRYNAYKHLLGVDPIFHTQQSSGVGIGKINRTVDAYRYMTKNLFDELIPISTSLITTIITLSSFDLYLGVATAIGIVCICTFFAWQVSKQTYEIEKQANHDDDRANHVGTESLILTPFIRSAFASDQVNARLNSKLLKTTRSMTTLFMTYRILRSLFILTYTLSIGCIAAFLLHLVKTGDLTPVIALSLVLTILRSTQPLLKIDARVRETISAYRKIKDFYRFINQFGKRTFPVLDSHCPKGGCPVIVPKDPITLTVENVTVAYPQHKPIFENLCLDISTALSEPSKLYGIIGPSGIGKTTFISLIGGQLKPPVGKVLINGYDIYELPDHERQKLIALQGQTATSMHGPLKYNLLFGLPYEHIYDDRDLVNILQSVGLWKLFKDKQGLQTMVGEGGTTLSGGQRQRLNFANLYLRAKMYKPALILIDEPTSSLDDISEQKITEMISQLAENSLTLVIAHRLKTLEDATKIMDFCLLAENPCLEFYNNEELKNKSPYYQQLLSGQASFDE